MGSTALVFAGGDRPRPDGLAALPPADLVIAADSGLRHARDLGVAVDLIVGDMDSVDADDLDDAVASGTRIELHPSAKDATDLELALLAARDHGCTHAVVVGIAGGSRVDHFLANALVLASAELAPLQVEAQLGDAHLYVVRHEQELRGEAGDLCSLLPLGGPVHGVRTENLRFPLLGETLDPGSTRGISNELTAPTARVFVDAGVLLAILPGARGESR